MVKTVSHKQFRLDRSELELYKVLLHTKLLPDHTTAESFIKAGLVNINGHTTFNNRYLLMKSDFIQLILSN